MKVWCESLGYFIKPDPLFYIVSEGYGKLASAGLPLRLVVKSIELVGMVTPV